MPSVVANTAGDAIFARPKVFRIALQLDDAAQRSLADSPKTWVQGDILVEGQRHQKVSVRVKGSTSYVKFGEKSSFTIDFARAGRGGRWDGLRRIHLNNSVQDSSYLCAHLCSEIYRRAGVPAARTAWALVTVGERTLGLYVLVEGLDAVFLDRQFGGHHGNFYDGGLHHEIDEPLVLDSGAGVTDRSDLKELHAAAMNSVAAERWKALGARLDGARFVSQLAVDTLTVNLDGYAAMQNNYRIYFPEGGKGAVFVVHGLDRMFEQPEWPVPMEPRGVVARGYMTTEQGREQYWKRLSEILEAAWLQSILVDSLEQRIQLLKQVEPLMEAPARQLQQRMEARRAFVTKRVAENLKPPSKSAPGR